MVLFRIRIERQHRFHVDSEILTKVWVPTFAKAWEQIENEIFRLFCYQSLLASARISKPRLDLQILTKAGKSKLDKITNRMSDKDFAGYVTIIEVPKDKTEQVLHS